MDALEYTKWDHFKNVIDKAIISCDISNVAINDHFSLKGKTIQMPKGAKKVIKLNTSGPFHTIKLQKASEEFAKCLENVKFNESKVDVIKNIDGSIYSKEDNIKEILAKHIISPVRFDKAIKLMNDRGIDTYMEIGPGKALSGFVKRELPDANVYTLGKLGPGPNFLI